MAHNNKRVFRNTILCIGLFVASLLFIPTNAQAQVCVTKPNMQQFIKVADVKHEVEQRITDLTIKRSLTSLKQEVMEAFKASTDVIIAGMTKAKMVEGKMLSAAETASREAAQQDQLVDVTQDVQPNKSDCVIQTLSRHDAQGLILQEAARDDIGYIRAAEYKNVRIDDGSDAPIGSSESINKAGLVDSSRGIEHVYNKMLKDYIPYYCNPFENAGRVPNPDQPITVDGQTFWCGSGRADSGEYHIDGNGKQYRHTSNGEWTEASVPDSTKRDLHLVGAPQNLDLILKNGFLATWRDFPLAGAQQALRRNLVGFPDDIQNVSRLNTASGRKAFVESRAKISKRNLASSIIEEAANRRIPTVPSGEDVEALCKDIYMSKNDAPDEIVTYCERIRDRDGDGVVDGALVSQATQLHAKVLKYTSEDYLQTIAQLPSEAQHMKELNKMLAMNLMITHMRTQHAERRNLLMAAILGDSIE